ncbi:MAG: glycerol-3-phosphate cytidylyltransferase [Aliiglaciecola sp.]
MKTVLTYGTFDLLHLGHIKMLNRLSDLGDRLIVGVSTDEFNNTKGKKSLYSFAERAQIVEAIKGVHKVIPENSWDQKLDDIQNFNVDIFGIGDDWRGKFDFLETQCEVVYLERTPDISTTKLKKSLSSINSEHIQQLKTGLDSVLDVVRAIEQN